MTAKPSRQARPGNANALHHGARSERAVSRRAGYEQQRVLKRLALRQSDLSPSGRYRLVEWSRAAALVFLMDAWCNEHGLLDDQGRPPAFTNAYLAARNSASRLYTKLEPHLLEAAKAKAAGASGLDAYLAKRYGEGKAKP